MKEYKFGIEYIEYDIKKQAITKSSRVPFLTIANTYYEGRNHALEHAQAMSRSYNAVDNVAMFYRIINV
jgi:hypothetical protein